ncbi:MAG: NUDIX domain-containing protein [Planctomycetes bacterium]|nr:NUDIX domain-containing protein [Planctomycetota bacterium]
MADREPEIEVIARGVWVEAGHLLLCRNRERGHLFLPGGHVEFNEPAQLALEREFREEAGLAVKAGQFIGVFEAGFDQVGKRGPRRHHELNFLFLIHPGRSSRKSPRRLPRGSSPSRPLRRTALRTSPTAPPHLPLVASLEAHIEFIWHPLLSPRARGTPPLRILPDGIEEYLRLALAEAPGMSARDSRPGWKSVWTPAQPHRRK